MRICQLLLLAGMALNLGYASDTQFELRFRAISETATRSELYAFFQEMPKGGILHLHSEYAVSPEFWLKIALSSKPNRYWVRTRTEPPCPGTAAKQVLLFSTVSRAHWARFSECEKAEFKPLPMLSADEQASWLNSLRVTSVMQGRQQFFYEIVPRLNDLCADPELMLQVLSEIMREAAAEHVLYLELQFDPTSLDYSSGAVVSESRFNELLNSQLLRPPVANLGVTVRFQLAAYRYASSPRKELSNAFAFVARHRDLWVGVNLLGEEGRPGGELSRFGDSFDDMRRLYDIPFSLHAGELDIPGHQVHNALVVGASRIGHAVNLVTDPDTVLLMRHAEIPIETSLVSNQILQYTPDLAQHPFPLYLRSGIPMCLNTDDPGAWGGSLTDEFFLAATLYHLSWHELVGLARNSLRYAFIDNESKAKLETRLNRELSEFELRMLSNDWRSTLRPSHQPSAFARKNLRLDDRRPVH
jgi:adenosine deaminase CECR1